MIDKGLFSVAKETLLPTLSHKQLRGKSNMKFRAFLTIASILLLASAIAGAQTADPINFNATYQPIRGFGVSTAWQPVMISTEANSLFGVGSGQIGLTILRSRIDPSSITGGSNWNTEVSNGKAAQGVNSEVIVFATPWTPPAAAIQASASTEPGTVQPTQCRRPPR